MTSRAELRPKRQRIRFSHLFESVLPNWHTRVFRGRESTVGRLLPFEAAYFWRECSSESFALCEIVDPRQPLAGDQLELPDFGTAAEIGDIV